MKCKVRKQRINLKPEDAAWKSPQRSEGFNAGGEDGRLNGISQSGILNTVRISAEHAHNRALVKLLLARFPLVFVGPLHGPVLVRNDAVSHEPRGVVGPQIDGIEPVFPRDFKKRGRIGRRNTPSVL